MRPGGALRNLLVSYEEIESILRPFSGHVSPTLEEFSLSIRFDFRWIFLALLLAAGSPVRAASSSFSNDQLRVELLVPGDSLYQSDQLNDAGIYFKLEPGWHIYWMNPGDAGEPPHVKWTLPAGITAGPMQFPAPKRLPLGPLMDYGYEDEVLFPLKLRVADSVKGGPVTLHAQVSWLVCRGSCIPGKADLEVQRKVYNGLYEISYPEFPLDWTFLRRESKSLPVIPKSLPAGAKAVFQPTPTGFRLTVDTGKRELSAEFFPEGQDILDNPAPQKLTPTANGLILDLKKDASLTATPKQLKGVLELSGGRAYEITALLPGVTVASGTAVEPLQKQALVADTSHDLVQPTYGLKPIPSNADTNYSANPGNTGFWLTLVRVSGLAFLGGLLLNLMPCVFPVLFLKGLALVNSGNEARAKLRTHGLVYAAGILVSFWALVGVLLGLRAAGATLGWGFQFQSPVFLVTDGRAALLSRTFACGAVRDRADANFCGRGASSKAGLHGQLLHRRAGSGCGHALYRALHGSGCRLCAGSIGDCYNSDFYGTGFGPRRALCGADAATGLDALAAAPRRMDGDSASGRRRADLRHGYLAGLGTCRSLRSRCAGGAAGQLPSAGDCRLVLGRWPARRWATAIAALILLGVIALTVFSQRLVSDSADAASQPSSSTTAASAWQPWSAEAVSRYQSQGRPVFVDFTASWCLSCQVNERVALNQPEVQRAFADRKVVLLRADWTRHDEAITQALTALGRSGVPAYALYPPGETSPKLLPEVLTPGIVTDALAKLPALQQK